MKVEMDVYKEIRQRYLSGESERSIARSLGIARQTVKKYCEGAAHPDTRKPYEREPRLITDEVIGFILECFKHDEEEKVRKQTHTSKKIFDRLVDEKDFTGGESTIRKVVRDLRKAQSVPPQSSVPLSYEPGEAVQIDWGEVTLYYNKQKVKLHIFCGRLCYSCDIFVQAFFAANEESFLEAQQRMFTFFGGIPRRVIFDNAKVAVKEGFGIYAKAQDRYLAFSAHYAFNLDFCNPGKGNEKGLVENLVKYARKNFFVPLPSITDIEALNRLLWKKCLRYRENHKIQKREHPVKIMYAQEQTRLNPLPIFHYDTSKTAVIRVDDYSTAFFEKCYYSVPTRYLRKPVTVKGFGNHVEIHFQNQEIASYKRSYKAGETQYKLEHYIDLLERKPRSVFNAKPVKQNVSQELMEWGRRLPGGNREMVKLLRLCIDHGEDRILSIKDAIPSYTVPTVDLVRAHLCPSEKQTVIPMKQDVPVEPVNLVNYDKKYGMVLES